MWGFSTRRAWLGRGHSCGGSEVRQRGLRLGKTPGTSQHSGEAHEGRPWVTQESYWLVLLPHQAPPWPCMGGPRGYHGAMSPGLPGAAAWLMQGPGLQGSERTSCGGRGRPEAADPVTSDFPSASGVGGRGSSRILGPQMNLPFSFQNRDLFTEND